MRDLRVYNFNPLAPRGARQLPHTVVFLFHHFNPLAPRGARRGFRGSPTTSIYFNPLAPRGARRDHRRHRRGARDPISIHSPLAGRDAPRSCSSGCRGISIHSPLAGRDQGGHSVKSIIMDFNPLAPRGARRRRPAPAARRNNHFNPLAPRGARHRPTAASGPDRSFQSTRPSRGETDLNHSKSDSMPISIHSPLAGRD